ncbi:MAG: MarR family transcriptional regulator [Anaerolineales bacterium]|jgi:DNA-binding MarR family transcriptional regulator
MPNFSHPPSSPETVKLLQRIVRLRSRFKVVLPENMATLKKQIHDSNQSGKAAGINDAGLFYNIGNVFSRYDGPISMGELSHNLEVPLSTATRTMDWLVNNGYAQRLADPNDRRIVRVELTKTGKETYQAISIFMLEKVEQAMSHLTHAERDNFIVLLNKVLSAFEEAA